MAIPASASSADLDPGDRWWRDGVVYQVYPRSFADSNGDGVGDLPGLIDHLDHLAGGTESLGVDAIWLSPIYASPMLDGGYDISDYTAIDPVFGTLADFDRLVEACHRRNVRVILDLVMNHTSNAASVVRGSRASRGPGRSPTSTCGGIRPGGIAMGGRSPRTTGSRGSAGRRGRGSPGGSSSTSTRSCPSSPT